MKRVAGNLSKKAGFLSAFFALLLAGFGSVQAQNTPPPPALTAAEWQADLRFLSEEMPKRHKNLFHRMKREDFDAAVKHLHDKIPTLSSDEIVVGIMKIVAMVGDGHTSVVPRQFFRAGFYPVQFYRFEDGLFIRKAAPEYSEMVGSRVVKINNSSVDEALQKVGELVARDNEWGIREMSAVYLSISEILAGLKITDDKQKLRLTVEVGGREKTFDVKPSATLEEFRRPPSAWEAMNAKAKNPAPLYQKNPGDLYWFEYLKDKKLVYVQHNAIANKETEPVADFYKRVMNFVAANEVEKFVLDLRFNGGGNNYLNRPVVIELIKSKINERGRLFVITGRQTFSAAQNLVNEIEKYTNATFVGEPTAASPNHFGDAAAITLPNSKLAVRASTLWWQDFDERDRRPFTAPEIAAEMTSADYRDNVDPAFEAILGYKPGTTYNELTAEARSGRDIAVFIKKYREFKSNPQRKFFNTESPMNQFGYNLLNAKRIDDAIEIFKLNAEAYPQSANVYDSLGDAYQAAGKKDEAIKAYEKALAIDPNYRTSIEALKKLKGQ